MSDYDGSTFCPFFVINLYLSNQECKAYKQLLEKMASINQSSRAAIHIDRPQFFQSRLEQFIALLTNILQIEKRA